MDLNGFSTLINKDEAQLKLENFGFLVRVFYHLLPPGQSTVGALNSPRGVHKIYSELEEREPWGGKSIYKCGDDFIFARKRGIQLMLDAKIHFYSHGRKGDCEGVIDSQQIMHFMLQNIEHDQWFFKANFLMPGGSDIVETNVGENDAFYCCAFVEESTNFHITEIRAFYCDEDEVEIDLHSAENELLVSLNSFMVNGRQHSIFTPELVSTIHPLKISNIKKSLGTFLRIKYEPK